MKSKTESISAAHFQATIESLLFSLYPIAELIQLVVFVYGLSNAVPSKTTTLLETYSPDCLQLAVDHDEQEATHQNPATHNSTTTLGTATVLSRTIDGVPISISFEGQTPPLSAFSPTTYSFDSASVPFIDCTSEHEEQSVPSDQGTALPALDSPPGLSPRQDSLQRIELSKQDIRFISPSQFDMPVLGTPGEPTLALAESQDGQEYLLQTNNVGMQVWKILRSVRSGQEVISFETVTNYFPLTKLMNNICSIRGDIHMSVGPLGGIAITSMEYGLNTATCVAYSPNIETALQSGFQLALIPWEQLNTLADYPTVQLQHIQDTSYLVLTINSLLTYPDGTEASQPIMVLEIGDTDLIGHWYGNPYIYGGVAQPVLNTTETPHIQTIRMKERVTNFETGTQYVRLEGVSIDLISNQATITPEIGLVQLPYPYVTRTLPQYGSEYNVSVTNNELPKVIEPRQLPDGTLSFIYTDLVAVDGAEEYTALFLTRLSLGPDGTTQQHQGTTLQFVNNAGEYVSVNDCSTALLPDGSVDGSCVLLDPTAGNGIVQFLIAAPDWQVTHSNLVRNIEQFYYGNPSRTGDYSNGIVLREGEVAHAHFLGTGSAVTINTNNRVYHPESKQVFLPSVFR